MPAKSSPKSARASRRWRSGAMRKSAADARRCAQHAPQRASLAGRAPAGLVDVDRRGLRELVVQVRVGSLQGCAGAAHDRIDGAGRELGAKQLAQELRGVASRGRGS